MKPFLMPITVTCLLIAGESALAASDRLEDGRRAYESACAECHETGIMGAPKTRNIEHWADRSNLWDGVLSQHAKKGFLAMPAKGGDSDSSDYNVEAAAEYMLTITHPDMPHD